MDFRSKDYTFGLGPFGDDPPISIALGVTIPEKVHLIKAGINYRFEWGKAPVAVMAKY